MHAKFHKDSTNNKNFFWKRDCPLYKKKKKTLCSVFDKGSVSTYIFIYFLICIFFDVD